MFSTFIQRKKLWTMDIILTVKDFTFVLLLFIAQTSCINCSSFCHSQTPAEQAQARMQMALKAAGMQIVNACTSTTVKHGYSEYTYSEFTLKVRSVSLLKFQNVL